MYLDSLLDMVIYLSLMAIMVKSAKLSSIATLMIFWIGIFVLIIVWGWQIIIDDVMALFMGREQPFEVLVYSFVMNKPIHQIVRIVG